MNTMFKKFATGTAALALMTTVFASTTMAAETGTTITGAPTVTMGAVSADNFGTVQLTGETQTAKAQLHIGNIVDARGAGDGWNVSVKASQLSQGDGGKVLSENKLAVAMPVVQEAAAGSSDLNTIATVGGDIDNGNGVKLLAAAPAGGMGSFSVDPIEMTLTLLPKEVYAGEYSTTVSVTLTAGPGL